MATRAIESDNDYPHGASTSPAPLAPPPHDVALDLIRLHHRIGEWLSTATAGTDGRDAEQADHHGLEAPRRRTTRPPLPDPRLVRAIIRQRSSRLRYFPDDMFADPAWDMLLDLTAARAEHTRVSVTSLCIASGVPSTTALRWITLLAQAGLVERVEDDTDRRRAFVQLTDRGADAMARYFSDNVGRLSLRNP